jgi:hypothetical protein
VGSNPPELKCHSFEGVRGSSTSETSETMNRVLSIAAVGWEEKDELWLCN